LYPSSLVHRHPTCLAAQAAPTIALTVREYAQLQLPPCSWSESSSLYLSIIGTHMNIKATTYPIGTPGIPWGDAERAQWLSRQKRQRSYADDVLKPIDKLRNRFDVVEYGEISYPPDHYRLFALRNRGWSENRPTILVTGGVHGYETSGVHGALQFLDRRASDYGDRINLLVVPCISPWAYERIHRWNANAIDPNRSFRENSSAAESIALMQFIGPMLGRFSLHIDLHETTDTDETEFRPAVAARDGKPFEPGTIPDGFYLVDDRANPQPEFQAAIIEAVAKITHIAPADANGQLIGSDMIAPGVIQYPLRDLGLCAGITGARYTTTTEVYPDSPQATPQQCNDAQVAAVCAAIDFVLERTRA